MTKISANLFKHFGIRKIRIITPVGFQNVVRHIVDIGPGVAERKDHARSKAVVGVVVSWSEIYDWHVAKFSPTFDFSSEKIVDMWLSACPKRKAVLCFNNRR